VGMSSTHTQKNYLIKLFFYFAPITQSVSTTLKQVSKRSSFRCVFQEHLLKFLMLAVTHSELLLRDHCTSKLTIVRLFTGVTNP
jgi:hypothetical protein